MSAFTDKHKNDVKLLLDRHVSTVEARLPKYGAAFVKRTTDDLQRPFSAFLDKIDAIRTSGRYSPDGERAERRSAGRAMQEQLAKVRAATVEKIEAQLAEARAAALKPTSKTTDPLEAILHEMRARETRDHWRTLDPLTLQTRIQQTTDSDLLDALSGGAIGFPVAPPDLIAEARIRIAEQNDPATGELAQLRDAYAYAIGVVEQTVLAASGLSELEVATAGQVPAVDSRKPILVSTGKEVTL
jgi:hypothetical protein